MATTPSTQSSTDKWLAKIDRLLRMNGSSLIAISDSTSPQTKNTVIAGGSLLTGGSTFTTASIPTGLTAYRSVSISVVSIGSGSVSMTANGVTSNITYQGLTLSWGIDKLTDNGLTLLSITATGNAIVVVNYTAI